MSRSILQRTRGILTTIGEIVSAVMTKRHRRFMILLPVLLALAVIIALITSSGALAPFVYPLF